MTSPRSIPDTSALSLPDAAQAYAAAGFAVFPVTPGGKTPLSTHGHRDATTDPDQIALWWAAAPAANIGLAPFASGIVVFDIDGPVAEDIAQRLGLLDASPVTITSGREGYPGRHLYFVCNDAIDATAVRFEAGRLVSSTNVHGLEVKAAKGYVVAAPSLHPSGRRYTRGQTSVVTALPPGVLEALKAVRHAVSVPVAQDALVTPDFDLMAQLVNATPNTEDSRDTYVAFGMAIKAASGVHPGGRALFVDWAQRWEGAGSPEEDGKRYDTFNGPYRIGFEAVVNLARRFGAPEDLVSEALTAVAVAGFTESEAKATAEVDAAEKAAREVEEDPDASNEAKRTAREAAEQTKAKAAQKAEARSIIDRTISVPKNADGEDLGKRLAALTGSAARAFGAELGRGLRGDAALSRWRELLAAEQGQDPLLALFNTAIVEPAYSLRGCAADPTTFLKLLRVRFGNVLNEAGATPHEQHVLEQAARLFAMTMTDLLGGSRRVGKRILPSKRSPDFLVDGWLVANDIGAFVADSNQGKTFLALDLAYKIASKGPQTFGGRAIKHGTALYFASEGEASLEQRLARWEEAYGPTDRLHVLDEVPLLSDASGSVQYVLDKVTDLPPDGGPLRLIVIDIWGDAVGGPENDNEVAGRAMLTATLIKHITGAAVLILHHTAKGKEQARGASAFIGKVDLIAFIKQDPNSRVIELRIDKLRIGAKDGGLTHFEVRDGLLHHAMGPGDSTHELPKADMACAIVRKLIDDSAEENPAPLQLKEVEAALREVGGPEYQAWKDGKLVVDRSTAQTRARAYMKYAKDKGWVEVVTVSQKTCYRLTGEVPPEPEPERPENPFEEN